MNDRNQWVVNPVIELLEIAHAVAIEAAAGEDGDEFEASEDHLKIIELLHQTDQPIAFRFKCQLGDVQLRVTFEATLAPIDESE